MNLQIWKCKHERSTSTLLLDETSGFPAQIADRTEPSERGNSENLQENRVFVPAFIQFYKSLRSYFIFREEQR